MDRPNFFTPEMGARLHKIRMGQGLAHDEVAARTGQEGKGRWTFVSRLEQGSIRNPHLSTVTFHFRACEAQSLEFYDLPDPD